MAKAYLYDLTDTWDSAGTTFNAIRMSVTDTASAAGSLLMNLQVGGANRFSLLKSGVGLASSEWQAPSIWATSVVYLGPSAQVGLITNGVGVLEQRGGVNPQTFRVYNTYTDASNYERGALLWTSNVLEIGTEAAGTGSSRVTRLKAAAGLDFSVAGNNRWQINLSGHFLAATDNTYDIGANGANRPRNVFAGNNLAAPYLLLTSGAGVARAYLASPANDIIQILLAAGSPGGALEFAEMTAPAAPAANRVRIYAEDNGSGKTRLMALFATGAAVQIAIEP